MTTPKPPGPSAAALHLHEVRKHFSAADGPVKAVDGINLRVERGEIVAFLGPNGAGKTTTIDMMLGLTTPSSGTVQVLGGSPRQAVRAGRVSAVMQTGGLLRDLSVRETVTSIAAVQGRLDRVTAVMHETQLVPLANRRVSKCSGGEQQRLKFALALLTEPDLLILDEPTAGMDVNARRAFWQTMRHQATGGQTIVFATHYLDEAESFAQRIVLIDRGTVIADGPTTEIRALTSGRTLSVSFDGGAGGANADLASDSRVRSLSDLAATAATTINGHRVSFTTANADQLAIAALDAGGHDLTITEPSLEDVFVTLTQEQHR